MIFTESTIKISNNVSKMDSTIVLYRGDKNVEIRFTILQSPFKYSNTVATNVIESTNASYGQLVIKTPNSKPPIFSEVSATKEGTILFTITKEMIDEIEEVGVYTFQIRLMDENKQSRVTIPPVENGIEIKEPIAIEDDNTTNVVGLAKANYAVTTSSDVDTPTFDDNGKYIKTNWNDGDIITNASLNKIEDGIYTTNENVTATKKYVDDSKEYINYNDKLINNNITALHISRNPVSCSTEINKNPLCELFPELLNMTYDTVFKKSISFKVNMDYFAKEYDTVKSAYNKIGINLYDENGNSIGYSYGSYINGDGLNFIYINTTQSIRFSAYFDKALVDGSNTSMETKNGYMTIQLSIPKGNNKKEFIDKIKNLKLSISVLKTDFLNLNNESIYTPTNDYNPATKKYVDDNILLEQLPILRIDETNKRIYVNCNNMGTYKKYFVPNKYANVYGFSFIYTNEDSSETEIALIGGAMTRDDFILCSRNTDTLFILILGGTDKYTYTKSTKTLEKGLYGYLKIGNTKEYTPTNDYNPATKKYVDDIKPDIDGIKTDLGFCIHGEIGKNLFDKNACEIGKYINETGGTGSNADYCASDFIKVIPGETYYMTAGNSSNFQFCYYNANKEFVQYTTGGYKSFTIPQDCVYVRFTIKKADLDVIQFEKGDIATNYESYGIKLKNNVVRIENLDHNLQDILNSIPPLIVKKYDDGIIFGFKYNSNEDMRILFKPCGQSKLPQINNIYKLSNSNKYPSSDFSNLGTIFQNATSDWIGPYTVRSSNDDGDKPDSWEFTGGWHGYNGDQTGEKTASNKSFKYYIDNKEILDGEVKAGNKLKIVVINNIQSSGTKKVDGTGREVLEETVVYNITQNNINVEVQIKALEQIKITKYYGLQTVNNSYNGQLLYNDDSMKKWTDCNNVKIDGGVKAESDCGEFKLKNNNDLLIAWVDKNYGLGKRKYVNDDKPVVWSADYNKTYMVLIDGNCDLQIDEVLYWRGGYKFISLV